MVGSLAPDTRRKPAKASPRLVPSALSTRWICRTARVELATSDSPSTSVATEQPALATPTSPTTNEPARRRQVENGSVEGRGMGRKFYGAGDDGARKPPWNGAGALGPRWQQWIFPRKRPCRRWWHASQGASTVRRPCPSSRDSGLRNL